MQIVRTLVVDDEPLARDRIRNLLEHEPDIEVVGECTNGEEAVAMVRHLQPDLLFLDVQMPSLDGFGVVGEIGVEKMPVTIFVTAYDQYALKAFEVHALDYLLKPFDQERFRKSLARARTQLEHDRASTAKEQLVALLEDLRAGQKPLERLAVKSGGRVVFLRINEIDWIEAAGNYLRLHVGSESHLLRETMNSLEERLPSSMFIRIHRSTIVNLERIAELQPWFHGDYAVILKDGTKLTLSRGYRQRVQERLGTLF